jgi:3-dehydroquinate synthase
LQFWLGKRSVIAAMSVKIATHPHMILMARGGRHQLRTYLPAGSTRCALITDSIVQQFHAEGLGKELGVSPIVLPAGEQAKSWEVALQTLLKMQKEGLDRGSVVIAVGGGCVSDLAGFVASIYMRGIALLLLPTTLLAMVDAAIGGKNGLNLDQLKNFAGTFYMPHCVLLDPDFLETLPKSEFASGMAEVIKHAAVADRDFFEELERGMPKDLERLIGRAAAIKARLVAEDERDQRGTRALLNYGHTFGHAIESLTEFRLSHGQSVAIGMQCAALVAREMELVDDSFCQRQQALLELWHLPSCLPGSLLSDRLIGYMRQDKKARQGKMSLVLPTGIGQARLFVDVPASIVETALRTAQEKKDE